MFSVAAEESEGNYQSQLPMTAPATTDGLGEIFLNPEFGKVPKGIPYFSRYPNFCITLSRTGRGNYQW